MVGQLGDHVGRELVRLEDLVNCSGDGCGVGRGLCLGFFQGRLVGLPAWEVRIPACVILWNALIRRVYLLFALGSEVPTQAHGDGARNEFR